MLPPGALALLASVCPGPPSPKWGAEASPRAPRAGGYDCAPPQGEGKGTQTEAWAADWHRAAEELSWSWGTGGGGNLK